MHFSNTTLARWTAFALVLATTATRAAHPSTPSAAALRPFANGADPESVLSERFAALRGVSENEELLSYYSEDERRNIFHTLARGEVSVVRQDWLVALRPYYATADVLGHATISFEKELEGRSIRSIEDLDPLARSLRERIDAAGSPLEGAARRSAAHQALIEQATTSARGYLASALSQGRQTSLRAGHYYLRMASTHAQVAQDLRSFDIGAKSAPLPEITRLSDYLASIEAELVELYTPPVEDHQRRRLLQLSASLKAAREMRAAGLVLGAFETALDVARGIAVLTADGAPADAALQATLEEWTTEIAGRDGDVSLPTVWIAEAGDLLATPDADRREVAAIVQRVRADYDAAFADASPTSESTPVAGRQVTVTLVRWPFT